MNKLVLFFFTITNYEQLFCQISNENKGNIQFNIAFNLLPINKSSSTLKFSYIDGNTSSAYPIDTINASYDLRRKIFGKALTIGIAYHFKNNLRTSIAFKPHFNSFLSNSKKDSQVYGIQFDAGVDYLFFHFK